MSPLNGYSFFCWLIVCCVFMPDYSVNGELFTAMVDMEKLLDSERLIVASIDSYLVAEEIRLKQLRDLKEKMSHIESIASKDVQSYLANPVNAFLLIKAVTKDWNTAKHLMTDRSFAIGQQMVNWLMNNTNHETFPSMEDYAGAVEALLRLQETYKLETSSLAKGEIKLQNPSPNQQPSQISSLNTEGLELSAGDCSDLGRNRYFNEDHYHTILWMQEALSRYEEEDFKTVDKAEILEHLAFSTYKQGNLQHALELTIELININPTHPRAFASKAYFEQALGQINQIELRDDNGVDVREDKSIANVQNEEEAEEESESDIFKSLCRGEVRISAQTASELFCYYLDTRNKPYLRYSRIKVEDAFKKPLIQIYHDTMFESEIEEIKELATLRLKRAEVLITENGEAQIFKNRINKIAWLDDKDNEIVNRVNQRIEDITGLTIRTAEALQVGNYGIGGHYVPHYDFGKPGEKGDKLLPILGGRIATWLNYMSNVEAGGATVFPEIGISIFPKQGSAAFWYNLHRNGEADMLTRHGACPVLVGSKWISTKWFREAGQAFLRPCGLTIDD